MWTAETCDRWAKVVSQPDGVLFTINMGGGSFFSIGLTETVTYPSIRFAVLRQ
jgi:hypothetical protein